MILPVPCPVCSRGRKPNDLAFVSGELDDNGIVLLECPAGHRAAVIFDARRYEVLLRSGGRALLSGFANESIASLAAALERAYEFYVRVICRERGIPAAELDAAWKEVATQSERQLGAFSFVYLLDNKAPLPLDQKIPTMRNRIVHQGRLAKESDAREFGRLVFKRIRQIERAMERYASSVEAQKASEIQTQRSLVPNGMEYGILQIMTVLAKDGTVTGPVESFDEYLEALQKSVEKGMAW